MNFVNFFAAILYNSCVIFLAECQRMTDTVATRFGNVRGLVVQPAVPGLKPVQVFLGIPYGTGTTGNRRFTMPQTAAKWTNMEKNATELPPVCIQQFPPHMFEPELALLRMPDSKYRYLNRLRRHLNKENENCLFMNIYVPLRAECQRMTDTVATRFGNVRGLVVQPAVPGLKPVQVFLGIPYSTGTTGNRRFTMPQTAAKWTNMEKNATELPPVCIQQFPPHMFEPELALLRMPDSKYRYLNRLRRHLNKENENCLFMNIYVPLRAGRGPQAGLPVLVLVHGESYMWNSGNPYNATILASHGQIIVITLNYRLGIFGFLSSGRESCRGNWGMSDILCALQFLREFIPPFGGDPESITLMGWGTGAAIVNLLMSSPMSAPAESRLFKRAILLGGCSLSSWAMVDQQSASSNFYRLAENAGCPTTKNRGYKQKNPDFLPDSKILDCIRSRPVFNLTKSAQLMPNPSFLSNFGPVIDGMMIVPTDKHGNLFRGLDLMIGLTTNETYDLLNYKGSSVNYVIFWNIIYPSFRRKRRDRVEGEPDTQTYLYVFGHQSSNTDSGIDEAVGNEDLPYILGYPLLNPDQMGDLPFERDYTTEEREISEAMMTYISNFVKKGSPLPRFDSNEKESFLFLSGEKERIGRFYRADKVAFWNKLIPALQSSGASIDFVPLNGCLIILSFFLANY